MAVEVLPPVTVTGLQDAGPNVVRLKLKGKVIGGWLSVRVTRGIERCPSDFELVMTEGFTARNGDVVKVVVAPLDPCEILIGKDLVLTGYVDRVSPVINSNTHTIMVAGRGKCQDIVDCSAIWPGGQITNSSVLQVAQKLSEPYGIVVNAAPMQDVGPTIPSFNVTYGESAYAIIEFMCRYRGLLVYELPDGSLHLSRATTEKHAASGFEEGVNIERAQSDYSVDQRYSHIGVFSQTTNTFQETGELNLMVAQVQDQRITRYRNLFVVNEAFGPDLTVHVQRAEWEKNRRYGRSQRISLTTDSWRDESGSLYEPNTLVTIKAPKLLAMPSNKWLISEVTYRRDDSGTHCDLVLMPPEAFSLPPIVIQTWPDVRPLSTGGAP
ncbi:MAG: contractile injection system protein, VgrG/Pvc8 family [Aquabacterium sp.]